MKTFMSLLASAVLVFACGSASAASATARASKARISMQQATKIALKTYPGKVVAAELEKEAGGSGLRYSFDISGNTSAHAVHEVGVDARTGKVLENSVENENDGD